jgi:hypothetical protein
MTLANLYASFLSNALGSTSSGNAPNVDYLSDDIRLALVTSSYTPDLGAHDFWDDVVANEASGTGYTANVSALASKTLTKTAANSWATQWAATTAYAVGDIVRPTSGNTFVYRCVVAGTSGGSQPTWPTVAYQTVTDGSVTWACVGKSVIQLDAADVSWASSTVTARYGVVYDRTPGSDGTRPLIALIDFETNQSTTNGTFAVTLHALGLAVATVF